MLARKFLATGFALISLIPLGCASEYAPDVQESDSSASAQATFNGSAGSSAQRTSEDAGYVSPVMAQQSGKPAPKPSVVQWIGPPQAQVDAKLVRSDPIWPKPTANQTTLLTTANRPDPSVTEIDQPIRPAEKPAINAQVQPAPTDAAAPLAKAAGDSGNPVAQQRPVALAKLPSVPAVDAAPPATVKANDVTQEAQDLREKASKIADEAAGRSADPGRALPPPTLPALPAARPIPPVAMAEAQNNSAKADKWLPKHPVKVVTFQSVLERLPDGSRPLASIGWDEFSVPRAHEWMEDQLAGVELQVAVAIVEVKVIRIPNAKDPDQAVGWELALTTKPERFSTFGMDTFHWAATWKEDVSGRMWRGGEVRFPVTEDFARQARLWHVGDIIVLSGAVGEIFVEGGTTNLGQPCGRFTTIFKDVHVDAVRPQVSEQ